MQSRASQRVWSAPYECVPVPWKRGKVGQDLEDPEQATLLRCFQQVHEVVVVRRRATTEQAAPGGMSPLRTCVTLPQMDRSFP